MTEEAPWEGALRRVEGVLARVETLLARLETAPPDPAIFQTHRAFRWERAGEGDRIVPIPHPHRVDLASLVGIDGAKEELIRNTEQFVSGLGDAIALIRCAAFVPPPASHRPPDRGMY
jgi:predicted AAA+ superfamily ATPase